MSNAFDLQRDTDFDLYFSVPRATRLKALLPWDEIQELFEQIMWCEGTERPAIGDPQRYIPDICRLYGDEDGPEVYKFLLLACGNSETLMEWRAQDEFGADDPLLVDLCAETYMRGAGLPEKIDEAVNAIMQVGMAMDSQLRDEEHAKYLAKLLAPAIARRAEDETEHAKEVAAGNVISLADFKKAKNRKSLPTAPDLAMRELADAEKTLVEAKENVELAKTAADLNAAIAKRIAAQADVDLAKQAVLAVKDREKRIDEMSAKVKARSAEIMAEIDASLAAEQKAKDAVPKMQYPPPNNAPLPSNIPMVGGLPMMTTQATVADLGLPIIDGFLVAQTGAPHADAPTLPASMNGHPLLESLNAAVGHMVAIAERRGALVAHVDVLAVLAAVHPETCKAVVARVRGLGCVLPESRLSPAISRFEASVAREVRVGSGWRTNHKGEPDPQNADNVAVLLRFVDADLRFNVWRQRIEIRRAGMEWQAFTDAELNSLRSVASCAEYGYRPTKEFFRDMLGNLARQTSYDPVLDYIDSAKWDGIKRLDTWLPTCCGVTDDDYHKAIGRNVIGGIVKRARHAGVKHDEVMILIGKQGCGKSNLTKVLALRPEWHTDGVTFEGRPQDIVPQFHGKLVIELSELDGMHRRDVGSVKRIISTSTDNFTAKYEAYSTDYDRRFIFIGTCNLESPLVDDSGNRRFYPVRIPDGVKINVDWARENIEQLIAEAATLEAAGETFAIPAAVWAAAAVVQEAARGLSAVEELLLQWFTKPNATGSAGMYVLSGDIVSALTMGRQNANAKVGSVMRRLGYVHTRPYLNGAQQRVWVKSPDGEVTNCTRLVPAQRTPGGVVEMRLTTGTAP